jgi:hypothetical protein
VWEVGEDGRLRHNWIERNGFEAYGVISRKGGKLNVLQRHQGFWRRMSALGLGCVKTVLPIARGARLIRTECRSRMKALPMPQARFLCCAPTTAFRVFTQPGT